MKSILKRHCYICYKEQNLFKLDCLEHFLCKNCNKIKGINKVNCKLCNNNLYNIMNETNYLNKLKYLNLNNKIDNFRNKLNSFKTSKNINSKKYIKNEFNIDRLNFNKNKFNCINNNIKNNLIDSKKNSTNYLLKLNKFKLQYKNEYFNKEIKNIDLKNSIKKHINLKIKENIKYNNYNKQSFVENIKKYDSLKKTNYDNINWIKYKDIDKLSSVINILNSEKTYKIK